jgi:rhodanese-related sulfurtransferase
MSLKERIQMYFFRQTETAPGISAGAAIEGATNGTITVIDVREHAELATSGKARGAHHVPLSRLQDIADPRHPDYNPALKTDARIAVYCASGGRSGRAQAALRQLGYGDVHNIGGFADWIAAGGDVERL